jgi:hypothetical protein
MSTSGPDLLAELEPQLAATGSTLMDAPILGAPTVVLRGGAAILVGGAPADVEHVRPVLGLLGEVRHVGALGSGARLKLVAKSMLGAVIMAAAELQSAGEAAGLDREEVFWALARLNSTGQLQKGPTTFACEIAAALHVVNGYPALRGHEERRVLKEKALISTTQVESEWAAVDLEPSANSCSHVDLATFDEHPTHSLVHA